MAEITLAKSYIHNYDGPNGKALREHDIKVIEHILKVQYRDLGYMQLVRDEVGTSCYTRVKIIYEGNIVFNAQETSNGDWFVNFCSFPIDSWIWKYVFDS